MWINFCFALGFFFALWVAWDEQRKQKIAKNESIRSYREAETSRKRLERTLAAYHFSREERYADFDKILRKLPDPSVVRRDYWQTMKSRKFDVLAFDLEAESREPISCGILDFEKSFFYWEGSGFADAWKRGGWFFMPEIKRAHIREAEMSKGHDFEFEKKEAAGTSPDTELK